MAWRALLFLMTSAAGGGVATGYQHFKLDCLLSIQKRGIAVTKSRDARVSGRVINCHLKHGSLHGGGHSRSQPGHTVSSCHSRELCAPKPIQPGYEKPSETLETSSHIRTRKATTGFSAVGRLTSASGPACCVLLCCAAHGYQWWLPVKPAFSCYGFLQFCCIRLHKP